MFSVSTEVVVEIKETMGMGVRRKLKMDLKLVVGLNRKLGRGSRGFVV